MNKIPAFQFYPADWRKDLAVQSLTLEERGAWIEMLCLMHESEIRGKLIVNSEKIRLETLAKLIGISTRKMRAILDKLILLGVASIDTDTGAIMSRRMVKDEHIRRVRAEAGKKGGNPDLLKQKDKQKRKQNPTPSSSSSSSSSSSDSNINIDAGARNRPTLDQAKAAGAQLMVTPDEAEAWWLARESTEWMKAIGAGGTTAVGTNWQADLKSYTLRCRQTAKDRPTNHRQAKAAREYPEPEDELPDA